MDTTFNPMKTTKASRNTYIRARCDHTLKAEVLLIAKRHGLDEADIVRMGTLRLVRSALATPAEPLAGLLA